MFENVGQKIQTVANCDGFNFLFGTYGFKRQNSFVGFERFTRFITRCDKSSWHS